MENKTSKILKETFAEITGELLDKMIAQNNLFPLYYQTDIVLKLKNSGSKEIFIRDVTRIWSLAQTKEFLFARFVSQNKKQSLLRKKMLDFITAHLIPNIQYNEALTQKRVAMIASKSSPTKLSLKKGELIIKRGERVNESQYEIIKLIEKKYSIKSFFSHFINSAFFIFILFSIFSRTNLTKNGFWLLSFKDSILFAGLLVFVMMFFQFILPLIKNAFIQKYPLEYLIPIASTGVIIHLLMGKEAGMVFSFLQAILLGYYFDGNFPYAVWCLLVSISSIQSIRSCKQRTDLYRCGLYSALIGMLTIAALSFWEYQWSIETVQILLLCCFSLLSGLFSAAIASSLIPVFESVFGYTTNLKLLELSNFNHPLLHELMLKAPGTYHHSVMVGSLAEIAAEKIKANGLLARVAAYYHDIGKMHKPMYFIENQSPQNNPHDSLQPTMSAKILFSHVRDGAKLSKDHNLGQKITEIIEQHHGTTLVSYFLNKAKKIEDNINPVLIEQFRYPGPKPQTKESAIVMLADACEASTRSISEPTPAKIQSMVHHIINKRFLDNQFSDCNLTMNELYEIEESFTRTLTSLYHHRIEYPGQSQNEETALAKKA
jgi:putative nucleotidyltransferase with HDIG domain